jgi:hypothetical protein
MFVVTKLDQWKNKFKYEYTKSVIGSYGSWNSYLLQPTQFNRMRFCITRQLGYKHTFC